MDCFYAAVELLDRPDLVGKPVAVGGRPQGRGVITTATYEARKFGVKSAIPSSRAIRLCPQLIIIPHNFEKYKKASREVRAIMERFTDKIEPLSLDEAYLDVTDCNHFGNSATLIAKEIRRLIFEETRLTASAGIAPNKFLAKVACEWNKPNGQKVIKPSEIDDFVKDLPVEKLFGVGKVTAEKMHSLGFKTCGDLQKRSIAELTQHFGSWAVTLYDNSRGICNREVDTSSERKSLSVENTFSSDLVDLKACLAELPELYNDWLERIYKRELGAQVRGAFVKLKFHDFETTTHEKASKGLPKIQVFEELLKEAFERGGRPVRLIGIGGRFGTTSSKPKSRAQLKLL